MDLRGPIEFIAWVVAAAALLSALIFGFLLVQIKCKLFWRLSSIVLVLIIYGMKCSEFSKARTHIQIQDQYGRRLQLYVAGLDKMALEGRTNEIHHDCEKFLGMPVLSSRDADISNFNNLASDTYEESITLNTTNKR